MKLLAAWISSIIITAVAAFNVGVASVPSTRTILSIPSATAPATAPQGATAGVVLTFAAEQTKSNP